MTPRHEPIEVSSSDWAALLDAQSRQQGQIDVLTISTRTITEQIAELTVSQMRADAQRQEHTKRLDSIELNLNENSQITRETLKAANDIKDLVTTARTGGKLIRWAAPTLVALGVAIGAIKGYWVAGIDWVAGVERPK